MGSVLKIVFLLLAMFNICASSPTHSNGSRPDRHRIPSWANLVSHPVYIYKWDRGVVNTIQMYGMNIIRNPYNVFNVTEAFGQNSPIWTHKWPRHNFSFHKEHFHNFSWKPIKEPQFGMGYEWEAQFETAASLQAHWVEVLMELEVPFDWLAHSELFGIKHNPRAKNERPLFNKQSMSAKDSCPSDLSISPMSCTHHLKYGCYMPWGSCRKSFVEVDRFRWPRCESCPIPLVQDFKWDLNQRRLRRRLDLKKINQIAEQYGLNEDQLLPLRSGMRTDTPLGKFHRKVYVVVWERAVRDMQAVRVLFEKKVGELVP